MNPPLLNIAGLEKRYSVPVLKDVDLTIGAGEVHALVGANGAGKTTLCNIVSGVTAADAGKMALDGLPYQPESIRDAEASGIRFVMQELNLVDALSVAENLFLGALPTRGGLIDFPRLFYEAAHVLQDMGLAAVDPRQSVGTLGIGHKQLIEIARALIHPCRLLILDEPTAALTDPQIEHLFGKIQNLRVAGCGIIYISHRMDEIDRIADSVTVLRDGEVVRSMQRGDVETRQIVAMMAGEMVKPTHKAIKETRDNRAIAIRGLSTKSLLRNIDLDIHYGEVLGIAGLVGAGRTELLRGVFGADPVDEGQIFLDSGPEPVVFRSPTDAVRHGIGMIAEDRKNQGLLLDQSITSNMTLAALPGFAGKSGWISSRREQPAVRQFIQSLDIACQGTGQIARDLSGGNQQKVCIARWLMRECRVLLFDEPTRGIDIHAKSRIYALLDELAAQGKAVVIVSSETRELMEVCDHIAVLSNGRLTAMFGRDEWTLEKIMEASFRAYVKDNAA